MTLNSLGELRSCCVTGHRPIDLFSFQGYNKEMYYDLADAIKEVVANLHTEHETVKFISGGAQGVDQLFFRVVSKYGKDKDIENWLYAPCLGQDCRWSSTGLFSKEEYQKLVKESKELNTYKLVSNEPYKPWSMSDRNKAMVNDSDIILGIYSGDIKHIATDEKRAGGTLHCLREAYKLDKPIVILNPYSLSIQIIKRSI